MPKKKKAFIDKSQSSSFAIVNRARRDPLSQDDDATKHVLTPTFTGNQRKKADKERLSAATAPADMGDFAPAKFNQRRFGGSEVDASDAYSRAEFDMSSYQLPADGYDYAKHMTEIGVTGGHYQGITPDQIAAREAELKEAARRKATGMVELREAVIPTESLGNTETYHSSGYEDLEYELDPEIMAAMVDAENDVHDDVEWEGGKGWGVLEDDFVYQAKNDMGGHLDYAMQQYEAKQAAKARKADRLEDLRRGQAGLGGSQAGGSQFGGSLREPEPEQQDVGSDDDWPSDDGQADQYSEEDEEEPPTEEEMGDQIFNYADEDGNGLLNLEEFAELQEVCGNETPNEAQWRMMLGALSCDPDPVTGGLTAAALGLLYGEEGPWDDFAALGFGGDDEEGEMPPELAALIAEREVAGTQDRGPDTLLDERFAAMQAEYDDEKDIGDLQDHPSQTRMANGGMEISAFESVLDDFISEQEQLIEDGMMILDNKSQSQAMKAHVLARAEAQAQRDFERKEAGKTDNKRFEEVAEYRQSARAKELADDWDAETIVSTYSNTENHPGSIATGRRISARDRKRRAAEEKAKAEKEAHRVVFGSALQKQDPLDPRSGDIVLNHKGMPMLQEENEAAILAAQQEEDEEGSQGDYDEDGEEEEEYEVIDTGIGRGGKRGKGEKETPEEKRARKAAVKAEKAEARVRKKGMKTAYKKEEAVQGKRQTSAAGSMRGRSVISMGGRQ